MAQLLKALTPKPAPSWHKKPLPKVVLGPSQACAGVQGYILLCLNFFNLQFSSLWYQEYTAGSDKDSCREAAEEAGTDGRKANRDKRTHRTGGFSSLKHLALTPKSRPLLLLLRQLPKSERRLQNTQFEMQVCKLAPGPKAWGSTTVGCRCSGNLWVSVKVGGGAPQLAGPRKLPGTYWCTNFSFP